MEHSNNGYDCLFRIKSPYLVILIPNQAMQLLAVL